MSSALKTYQELSGFAATLFGRGNREISAEMSLSQSKSGKVGELASADSRLGVALRGSESRGSFGLPRLKAKY